MMGDKTRLEHSEGFMLKAPAALIVLAVLAQPALATQHIVDIAWDKSDAFAHAAAVPAGRFLEVCGGLKVGEAVRWRFSAAAPLDFNVHYHVGKSTQYPAKLVRAAAGDGVLQVGVKETYCWMWTNKSADEVRLDLQLQR